MTQNQIAYWSLQEQRRSNLADEAERKRANTTKEIETERSNRAKEEEARNVRQVNAAKALGDLSLGIGKLGRIFG